MPDPKESQQEFMKEIFKDCDDPYKKFLSNDCFIWEEEQYEPILISSSDHIVSDPNFKEDTSYPANQGCIVISLKSIDKISEALKELGKQMSELKFDSLASEIEIVKAGCELVNSIPYGDSLSLVPRFGVENKNHPFSFESIHSKKSFEHSVPRRHYCKKAFMGLRTNQNLRF